MSGSDVVEPLSLEGLAAPEIARSPGWRWWVAGLLLAATAISYMDRQVLGAVAVRIKSDLLLNNAEYGALESGFSLAFAAGSILFGILADRFNVRYIYPIALLGWSLAGFFTGFARTYGGLLVCRVLLGLFEAGHWPCAMKTVKWIFMRRERSAGNSIVQSGAAIGAIITPLLVQHLLTGGYGWRFPFPLVGAAGVLWIFLWLTAIRTEDLARPLTPQDTDADDPADRRDEPSFLRIMLTPRFVSLLVMVPLMNVCFHLLRAWLPLFLQEGRHYTEVAANTFTSLYYVAADVGALTAGFLAVRLARRGMPVNTARRWIFLGASLLTLLTIPAALLPASPALLATLLLVSAGALAVFPLQYAFSQELSYRHHGKVTGVLAVSAWVAVAAAQSGFGRFIDAARSFDFGIAIVGAAPLVGLLAVVILWGARFQGGTRWRRA